MSSARVIEPWIDGKEDVRHTALFSKLHLLPVGECNLRKILFWFPSRSKLLTSPLVVFPIDFVLGLSSNNAFGKDSADLVELVLVKFAVGMRRIRR